MQAIELRFSSIAALIHMYYAIRGQIIVKFDRSSCFLLLACGKKAEIRGFCTRVYYTPIVYPPVLLSQGCWRAVNLGAFLQLNLPHTAVNRTLLLAERYRQR